MSPRTEDHFLFAKGAWRYSLTEGLRTAATIGLTILIVGGGIGGFSADDPIAEWLFKMLKVALLVSLPISIIFTIWARIDLWNGNKDLSKN
jgi:hypothetical protein